MQNQQSPQTPQDRSSKQQQTPGKDGGTDFGQRGQAATNPTDAGKAQRPESDRAQGHHGASGPETKSATAGGKGDAQAGQPGRTAGGADIDVGADEVESDQTGALNSTGKRPGQNSSSGDKGRDLNDGNSQNSSGRSGQEHRDDQKSGNDKSMRGS